MEVKGKVKHILPIQSGNGAKGEWKRQDIVVSFDDNGFEKNIAITFFGDKVDRLKGISEGRDVEVSVNVSSREYNGRWYTQVDGWKIKADDSSPAHAPTSGGGSDVPF